MKTLKKTLCLILAVVMVVGVLILPAHAADDYTAAVTALQNYKVIQGKGDGLIHADDPVTRADMAAIVYRIMTGDTQNPTAANATAATKYGAYAAKYPDAKEASWAIGYIGFCSNQGVLKGDEMGNVKPNQQITGYEVQAMLLRALGYDKNNEYTGKDWKYNILADATKTGISKGVSSDPAGKTLRGAVAQLTLNAATGTYRVAPAVVPNIGYNSLGYKLIENVTTTPTGDTTGRTLDTWGAPTYVTYFRFTWPDTFVYDSYKKEETALYDSYVAKTECDVAEALTITSSATAETYTNGKDNKGTLTIQATDTLSQIGARGRHTRIYANPLYTATNGLPKYIVTYVDTFLGTVDKIVEAVKDAAGHVITPARIEMTIHVGTLDHKVLMAYDSAYAKNDVLRMNVKTATASSTAPASLGTNAVPVNSSAANTVLYNIEKIAPTQVTLKEITKDAAVLGSGQAEVGFLGTNGTQYYYSNTFGGTTAKTTDIGKTYNVWTDSQGNVLRMVPVTTAGGYGVVTGAKTSQLDNGNWVVNYSILLSNKTTVTVPAFGGAALSSAEALLTTIPVNTLVSYVPDTDHSGCYTLTKAKIEGYFGGVDSAADAKTSVETNALQSGVVKAFSATQAGSTANYFKDQLVNDSTVFFVPKYTYMEATGKYTLSSWEVYTGFQSINDLMLINGKFEDGNQTQMKVTAIKKAATADGQVAGMVNGKPGFMDYVFVQYANYQTTPTKTTADKYAFLVTEDDYVNVGNGYYDYRAVLDGVGGKTLRVTTPGGTSSVNTTGLYTYEESANDMYSVTASTNIIFKKNYSYSNGVITVTSGNVRDGGDNGARSKYLTVAKDAAVYLVNPITGGCSTASLSILSTEPFNINCPIWYQLDELGRVNLIYVVDTAGEDTTAVITAVVVNSSVNPQNLEDLTPISNVEFTATATPAAGNVTVTAKWSKIKVDGGTVWEDCAANELFRSAYKYKVTITLTAGTSSKFADTINVTLTGGIQLPGNFTTVGNKTSFESMIFDVDAT